MSENDLDRLDSIMQGLPLVIPRGPIDVVDEEYQYRSNQDVYRLRKAPVFSVHEVTGTKGGTSEFTFEQGVDYQLIDDDGDGNDDAIEFLGNDTPDSDTLIYVDYRCDPVISRYVGAHDEDVDRLEDKIDQVIKSAQVDRAEGDNLERVGAIFDELGRRAGRTDSEYRSFLKFIVQSFSGRGTKPGIKFAISAGTGISTDDITITEDFDQVGYEISIDPEADTDAIGQVINEMAELADPSGVELLSEPVFVVDGDEIVFTANETTVDATTTGLGGNVLTLDGNSTLQ